ncbi:MAG: hypothetical protein FWC68_02020, partial [Oscillospiraceae bacterium]|nr:hypothetical protein [Oscillospiraceae bacterium]
LGKTSRYKYKMERHLTEKGQMKQYYINLGVPEEFIELVKIKNLRAAKEIVEGYDFGRELTNEEKSGILQAILNHSHLTRKTSTSLSSLIKALGLTGELTEQEIYGAIIKLSVNGGIDKHSYSEMINSSKYVSKFVEHYLGNKGTIDLKVTKSTIQRATADNLSEEQKSDLIEEFQRLGIPKRIVESIDTRNLWSAKQIVEGHNFGRELENEEKKALLQCILNHSHLGWKRKGRRYLSILMQNLEDAEFEEQEICGIIINTAVNRSIIPIKGYGYGELLCKRDKVLELKKYADEIDSEVTEYTIAKAKVMPIRIAKKAIGELAKKGDIAAIPTTGAQLTELERGETQTYEDPNK